MCTELLALESAKMTLKVAGGRRHTTMTLLDGLYVIY